MENWKDVIGFNGKYQVSDLGGVRSFLPTSKKYKMLSVLGYGKDYPRVNLSLNGKTKSLRVHRLVATAFIPNNENKPIINHKDGSRTNNNLSNLEWCSYSENIQHAYNSGLRSAATGIKHCKAKMTELDAQYAIWFLEAGARPHQVAKIIGKSAPSIYAIASGTSWRHLPRAIKL